MRELLLRRLLPPIALIASAAAAVSACGTTAAHSDATPTAGGSESPLAHAAAIGNRRAPASPPCTQTLSSIAAAASALSSAAPGSAICLSSGAYGHLELSGTHSGNVTIEPAPGVSASIEGASVATGASYITIHNFAVSGGVDLAAGDSHITIDHDDIDGEGPGGKGEGVQDITVNCAAPNAPTYSDCASTPPDTYIAIVGNKIHGYGAGGAEDAIHLNNWEHVTVAANEIYDLEEHGNHTDALQSVFGGHHLTFAYNYEHDNQAQGFFINDGDAGAVTLTENLFLRNDNEPALYPGGEYDVQVFNTTDLTMTDNTVWDGQDDILRANGAAEALSANVNHNVERTFNVLDESGPAYSLRDSSNIYAEAPWTIRLGPHSRVLRRPPFIDPAADDYRLRRNRRHIGVDWKPSEYVYGPTGD
jgi:hypothetical protein